jgi:hypothetical protein
MVWLTGRPRQRSGANAAAIGRELYALLAAVVRKLETAWARDRLIEAGLLFRQGLPPHAIRSSTLVQDAAYGTCCASHDAPCTPALPNP